MPDDIHVRARRLIECDPVEGIAQSDREWLDRHIETCSSCADFCKLTRRADRRGPLRLGKPAARPRVSCAIPRLSPEGRVA